MRAFRNEKMTHGAVLNDLMTPMSSPADIRTGSGHSADVMARTIAVVKIGTFSLVSRNSAKQPQETNCALRACALEADWAALKSYSNAATFNPLKKVEDSFFSTAENLFEAFLVDRRLQYGEEVEYCRPPFKCYGGELCHLNSTGPCKGNKDGGCDGMCA